MSGYHPFSADGHAVRWTTWDGSFEESTTISWENEGFTVHGRVQREAVDYVIRVSPTWHVRQFILFRDLDEPDLWLATDGHARWGEMNGAHREELDGARDISLSCTPFTATLPIRRLPMQVGDSADLAVVDIDVETLEVRRRMHRYTRLTESRWSVHHDDDNLIPTFEVDEYGVVVDMPDLFRRAT
jgi:uncharacterized protein